MSGARLEIAPPVARGVLDHALEAAPDECCGILLGPAPQHAAELMRSENVHENPRTEYEIAPEILFEAVERTEKEDLEVVGFYHSHPRGAAAFSKTDRARGSWEGTAYLLVSLAPLAFRAGRWTGRDFEALPVHVGTETG